LMLGLMGPLVCVLEGVGARCCCASSLLLQRWTKLAVLQWLTGAGWCCGAVVLWQSLQCCQ
jgi:hypothetical protein